jgi:hypothetical protein
MLITMAKKIIVNVSISAEDFQRLYQGSVKDVLAYSTEGLRIRFPASILRPYVLHSGVQGLFQIEFDEANRFKTIERVVI